MHKYRITSRREEDVKSIKFTNTFMKDFPSSADEVQRILDVASQYQNFLVIRD